MNTTKYSMRNFFLLLNFLLLSVISALINMNIAFAQETKNVFPHNVFSYKIGNIEVYLLSEGQQNGNTSILIGATPEMLQKAIPEGTFTTATNVFLVRSEGKNILIDAGYGRNLFDNLQSLGINSEQIDVVLITHMHGDHIGGLLRDGKATFPNATLYLSQAENDYWTSDKEMNKTAENRRGGFQYAQEVINAYPNRHLFIPDEIESKPNFLFPEIQGIVAYGHTPGHTMFMLGSGKQKILIWGDLTHALPVQMLYPQLAVIYDVNTEQAISSRKKVLEYVSKNNIPIAGMHIAFPGMGNIKANSEGGYIFTPLQ